MPAIAPVVKFMNRVNRVKLGHEFRFLLFLYLSAYSFSEFCCIIAQGFSLEEDSPFFIISALIIIFDFYSTKLSLGNTPSYIVLRGVPKASTRSGGSFANILSSVTLGRASCSKIIGIFSVIKF